MGGGDLAFFGGGGGAKGQLPEPGVQDGGRDKVVNHGHDFKACREVIVCGFLSCFLWFNQSSTIN